MSRHWKSLSRSWCRITQNSSRWKAWSGFNFDDLVISGNLSRQKRVIAEFLWRFQRFMFISCCNPIHFHSAPFHSCLRLSTRPGLPSPDCRELMTLTAFSFMNRNDFVLQEFPPRKLILNYVGEFPCQMAHSELSLFVVFAISINLQYKTMVANEKKSNEKSIGRYH